MVHKGLLAPVVHKEQQALLVFKVLVVQTIQQSVLAVLRALPAYLVFKEAVVQKALSVPVVLRVLGVQQVAFKEAVVRQVP